MAEPKRISETVLKAATGFRAELSGLELPTLLQLMCARSERSVLRVRSGAREGYVFLAEGRVVHASLGVVVGEAALTEMLTLTGGEFKVCERPWPQRYTIQESLESVLIRAAQKEDEAGRSSTTGVLARSSVNEILKVQMSASSPSTGAVVELVRKGEGPLIASVRIDVNGAVISQSGNVDILAPLVAYVTRIGALMAMHLGLPALDALTADLGEHKALIFVEGEEMVGLLLVPGPTYNEVRQHLGV